MRLSVYVHFPYCERRCPYCDFATIAAERGTIPHEAYADAVIAELKARTGAFEGAQLHSIFFGGGTPSLWESESMGRVIEAITRQFGAEAAEVEVTAECNPSSLDRKKAQELRAAGVNRLSIGVQSLNDERLRFLGRLHDAEGAKRALEGARTEFERVSADMIFAAADQSEEELLGELEELLAFDLEHLSLYALTIEEGTPFFERLKRGKLPMASDDRYARLFLEAEARLLGAGYRHYEISNYARAGAESAHNLHYWRGGAYLGLGAAAVGCLPLANHRAIRRKNRVAPSEYLNEPAGAPEEIEELEPLDRLNEAIMLGLRLEDGLSLSEVRERTGLNLLEVKRRAIERRIERGDLLLEDDRLRVPRQRWLGLDSIVVDLF